MNGVSWHSLLKVCPDFIVASLLATAIAAISCVAPTETSMGDAQRVLYVHVSVAWLSLLGFVIMAAAGLMYLLRRRLAWDHWAQSASELGWLCCSLTLVTGSLWAHAAWATWWTWDPRLTTSFILWLIYSGCWIARSSLHDPHRRAQISAVLAIVGLLDIPLVVMATRWFRGIHPVSPEMEPSMYFALASAVVGFTACFTLLFVRRRDQLRLETSLWEMRPGMEL
jgi:heme exporter protein C